MGILNYLKCYFHTKNQYGAMCANACVGQRRYKRM